MPKKQTYEQSINNLELIISKLEDPSTPLEESLKLYKEGMHLAKFCNDKLEEVEGEISVLRQIGEGVFKKELIKDKIME